MTFSEYCKLMYDENCRERWVHNQVPYANVSEYVNFGSNRKFLKDKFKESILKNE